MRSEHTVRGYVLAHDGAEAELRRMALLDQFHGPLTLGQLWAAGAGPGSRCLEVGAGAGLMTRRLAKLVGPAGRVVAIDLETHWLEPLRSEIVEIRQGDITRDPLPSGFDLVLAQMLLLHLPDPAAGVQTLLGATAPGGRLVIHDADFTPVALHAATEAEAEGLAVMAATMRAAGVALGLGPKLEELLRAAGAEIEDVCCEPSSGPAAQGAALVTAITLERFHERAVAEGASPESLAAVVAALRDPERVFTGPARWVVRARRPA
jgi:Methyltransferase domain